MLAARLAAFALGVALDDVLDDQGDVPPHEARADQQQHATGHAHRCDEGERDDDAVQPADGVGDGAEDHAAGEAAEDQRVDAEHGEADGPHLGRRGGGQGQEDADGQRRHRRLGHELQGHAEPELGDVERDDEERAVGRDAEPRDGQRALGRPPEVAVADHVGHRQAEKAGHPDDGLDFAAAGGAQVELVVEEEIAEEGRPGAGEAQDGHGHQLEVERPDAQEPGHRGAQQDPGGLLLLGLQIHAGRLEDVTGFVGPLLRLAQPQHEKRHREPGQTEQQSIAPVVGEGHHEAEEEQADRAREGIGEVVPAEDPSPALGRVGIGQVRVVHRVVDPEPDGGDQVEEHEPPDVGERPIKGANTATISKETMATSLRLPRSAHSASGTAHSSWAACATKATAPRPALERWNERSRLTPTRLMP